MNLKISDDGDLSLAQRETRFQLEDRNGRSLRSLHPQASIFETAARGASEDCGARGEEGPARRSATSIGSAWKRAPRAQPGRAEFDGGSGAAAGALSWPVRSVCRTWFSRSATEIPVTNGMAVTVEVKTGQRRIIDYIFSPLVEVASTAMKER
jgi:hypothetical protein